MALAPTRTVKDGRNAFSESLQDFFIASMLMRGTHLISGRKRGTCYI
jgi:hypothetical protein